MTESMRRRFTRIAHCTPSRVPWPTVLVCPRPLFFRKGYGTVSVGSVLSGWTVLFPTSLCGALTFGSVPPPPSSSSPPPPPFCLLPPPSTHHTPYAPCTTSPSCTLLSCTHHTPYAACTTSHYTHHGAIRSMHHTRQRTTRHTLYALPLYAPCTTHTRHPHHAPRTTHHTRPGGSRNAANYAGNAATLPGATQVSFVLAGAAFRGSGPVPRARSGRANGRRETGAVCAGRLGI